MPSSPWRVETSAGAIHAHAPNWHAPEARKARAVDTRPLHVRMREMKDQGATWEDVATAFGRSTGSYARSYVLAAEGKASNA